MKNENDKEDNQNKNETTGGGDDSGNDGGDIFDAKITTSAQAKELLETYLDIELVGMIAAEGLPMPYAKVLVKPLYNRDRDISGKRLVDASEWRVEGWEMSEPIWSSWMQADRGTYHDIQEHIGRISGQFVSTDEINAFIRDRCRELKSDGAE